MNDNSLDNPLNDLMFSTDSTNVSNENIIENSILSEKIDHHCAWCNKNTKTPLQAVTKPPVSHVNNWYKPAPYSGSDPVLIRTPLSEPYVHKQLCFCNFACAKLYHDNIMQIIPDIDNYRKLWIEDKLTKTNTNIYNRVAKKRMGFDGISIKRCNEKNCPITFEDRAKWSKILANDI